MTGSPKWRERFAVHPLADSFPMMSDMELDAMVEDIKARGLQLPIAVRLIYRRDENGRQDLQHLDVYEILDGRNRVTFDFAQSVPV